MSTSRTGSVGWYEAIPLSEQHQSGKPAKSRSTPVSVRNNSSQGEAQFGQSLEVFAPRRALIGFGIEY